MKLIAGSVVALGLIISERSFSALFSFGVVLIELILGC